MSSKKLVKKSEKVLEAFRKKKLMLATAESCTGGMLSMLLTDVAGSSDVFERGFVTYSNLSKTQSLGVPPALIKAHGAVSKEVAEAMAQGAIDHSDADVAVAITGVAGPGKSEKKPAGLVYIAVATRRYTETVVMKNNFKGGRDRVRRQSVEKALTSLKKIPAFF
ncbi:MAG: CinA family protein [Rickettsiales bacterium]|nr:CinA family protein [Rickettsiales bacterium]